MYEGPEFRHLISFLAIAEQCSFSRAARNLHISQPSLSAQIKQIEEGIGASLFKRTRSGAELTMHGRAFLLPARRMLQLRAEAVREASPTHSARTWPLRLGYTPFANHGLVEEALTGYRELVPDGTLHSSAECTAAILQMIEHERLDAGIVSLPVELEGIAVSQLCREKLLLCMRCDDEFADVDILPKEVIADRLRILFSPVHHPRLYEKIMRQFAKAEMKLRPTEFVSGPADMQFLVKIRRCYGLVRESIVLDSGLKVRKMPGLNLSVQTALVFKAEQERPVLPLLAYRMQSRCVGQAGNDKKPVVAEISYFNSFPSAIAS